MQIFKRAYNGTERVWTGRYRNLHNLPHRHLENELICVERGRPPSPWQQEYLLTEGDAIFLGSGEIHYIKSDPDSITAITLFDAALTASLTNCCQLCCARHATDYDILHVFPQIQEELFQQRQPFRTADLPAAPPAYDPDLSGRAVLVPMTAQPEHSSISNYKNLLTEIERNYCYITFSDAASFMGLSEPYFSRFFRKISRHDIFQISEHSAAGTCHRHAAGSHTETVCD